MADPTRPGDVYVVANDDPTNGASNTIDDVVFVRSADNGNTWIDTTLDTGPAGGTLDLFPTAAIDPFGDIFVSWLSNRNGAVNGLGNWEFDVFARYSTDGGVTWSPAFQVNDFGNPLNPDAPGSQVRFPGPPPTFRIGEYFGVDLFGGTAYVAWHGNDPAGGAVQHQVFYDAVALNGSLTVNGDQGGGPVNDNFVLQMDPNNPNFVEVLDNGTLEYYGLLAGIAGGIQFNGLAGADNLTINFANGDPIPSGGLGFDGGTGSNSMNLTGGAETAESYSPGLKPGEGNIAITVGGIASNIHFDNLAHCCRTSSPARPLSTARPPTTRSTIPRDRRATTDWSRSTTTSPTISRTRRA